MKTLIVVCMFLGIAAQQPMPPPGNPGHKEPAPNAFCHFDPKDGAHNCTCHRECKNNDDGTKGTYLQEDYAKCRSSCYPAHCHCPLHNCE